MHFKEAIHTIWNSLQAAFTQLDGWCNEPEAVQQYQPSSGGWTINQVLEHVSRTNHFLLILIRKGKDGALKRAPNANLTEALATYSFTEDRLREISRPGAFAWHRPAHMEPTGDKTPAEVKVLLKEQLHQCLEVLQNGEGILYQTTMSVNNLGKLNVYEYLYFLSRHAMRHAVQMEKVKAEMVSKI